MPEFEGVPQALRDLVNGDLDGKAIHCSCLVKGFFDLRIRVDFVWASLSFTLSALQDGKKFHGLKIGSLVDATRTSTS